MKGLGLILLSAHFALRHDWTAREADVLGRIDEMARPHLQAADVRLARLAQAAVALRAAAPPPDPGERLHWNEWEAARREFVAATECAAFAAGAAEAEGAVHA